MNDATDATRAPTPSHAPSAAASAATPAHGLAGDLQRLEETANGMPITFEALLDTLRDRGHAVIILLLSAPFVVIPVPGLSTIVGVVIFGLSVGVLFNTRPWMPEFIRRRTLSAERLHGLVGGTTRVLQRVERHVKPRMEWLTGHRWHWLIGISLLAQTVAFALPLPIPGNNIPPAIGLVLLSLGLLERDGLIVLIGHLYTLLMWAVLILLAVLFWEAVQPMFDRISSKLGGVF